MLAGTGLAEYWLFVPAARRTPCRCATRPRRRGRATWLSTTSICTRIRWRRNSTGGATALYAFWERQGTVRLSPGPHWIRVEGMLPDIVALRLEPVPDSPAVQVPWQRDPVPAANAWDELTSWASEVICGAPSGVRLEPAVKVEERHWRFSATFENTDVQNLSGGDAVCMAASCAWDLEPYGRVSFRFAGSASGHVVSLVVRDIHRNERILWRYRDVSDKPQAFQVPLLFEGNDVFDANHVRAVCAVLDEGNLQAEQRSEFQGTLSGMRWERRDVVVPPDGYEAAVRGAHERLDAFLGETTRQGSALSCPDFRPWTRPIVPEEHPRFAATDPRPVTRATLGDELHCTGAGDRQGDARPVSQGLRLR